MPQGAARGDRLCVRPAPDPHRPGGPHPAGGPRTRFGSRPRSRLTPTSSQGREPPPGPPAPRRRGQGHCTDVPLALKALGGPAWPQWPCWEAEAWPWQWPRSLAARGGRGLWRKCFPSPWRRRRRRGTRHLLLSGTGTGGHLLSPPAGSPFGHRHSQGQSPRTQSCHRRKRRPERPVTAESPAGVRPGRGGSAPRRAPPQRSRTRFPRPLLPGPLAGQRLARREDSQSRRHPRDGEAGQWPVPRPQQQPLRTPGARCRDRRPPLLPDSILRVPEPQEGQGPVFSPGDQHPRTWTVGPVCWNAHLLEGTGVPLLRKP